MKKSIDFLGIGAPKSGTTSLFHYMQGHPEIYMPAEKELPFFNSMESEEEWEDFYLKHFEGKESRVCGKITPQYMNLPQTPKNIHQVLPEVKFIVILRNPIDRAYSYYAMKKRNFTENRSFEEVVERQISMERQEIASVYDTYLWKSEYGKILSEYLRYFSPSQFLILFSEDLKNDRVTTIKRVFRFLSVDESYTPENLEKDFFVGGDKVRFSKLHSLSKNPVVRVLLKIIPISLKKKIRHWFFNEFNVVKSKQTIDPKIRKALVEYFEEDLRLLERSFDIQVPWKEFRN